MDDCLTVPCHTPVVKFIIDGLHDDSLADTILTHDFTVSLHAGHITAQVWGWLLAPGVWVYWTPDMQVTVDDFHALKTW
eukprot:365942-Chlamydomonas_euryale.AAC.14